MPVRAEPLAEPERRRGDDRVEVSGIARLLSKLREVPPVRQDLVERVRSEIDAGAYETADKIDQAVEAVIRELDEEL